MSTFLKSLRRAPDDEVAELQALAARLETQHATLGPLLQHGDRAIAQLQRLATLGERVEGLERQVVRCPPPHLPPHRQIGRAHV